MKEFKLVSVLKDGTQQMHIAHGPVTVVICGDSVSHGCLSVAEGNHFDTVYHNRLRMMINTAYPAIPVNIINNGVGGLCADYAVKYFDRDVACHHPDLVIVCFGLNDVNGTLEDFMKNLGELFDKINDLGTDCIYMTPNMMNTYLMDDSVYPHDGERNYVKLTVEYQLSGKMDRYIDAAKALAESKGVTVCDCYAKWKAMYESGVDVTKLLANYINHPTREMHALFAESLYETIFSEPYAGDGENKIGDGLYKG